MYLTPSIKKNKFCYLFARILLRYKFLLSNHAINRKKKVLCFVELITHTPKRNLFFSTTYNSLRRYTYRVTHTDP